MQGSFLFYSLLWGVNPPQHTTVSQRQIHSSQSALPLSSGCCVRTCRKHGITQWSRQGLLDPAPVHNPHRRAAAAPDPPSASANVLAGWGRQLFCGLFHVGLERRPALTLALLGQTGGRRYSGANKPGETNPLWLLHSNYTHSKQEQEKQTQEEDATKYLSIKFIQYQIMKHIKN